MKANILTLAITLTVGIILAGSLLMPVISDATTTERTYTNEGVFYMTDDPTDYVMEYKGTDGEIWVNGEMVIKFTDIPNSTWTLLSTPEYLIRMQGFGSNYALWLTSVAGTNTFIGNNTTESATITLTDSTIQVGTGSPVSYSGEFRGLAKEGDYVMTSTGGFTVSDTDTIIIGNGTTGVTHWYDAFYIIGTVEDIEVYSSDSITVSNVDVNATKIPNFNGSTVTSITFTATDGTNTTDATYDRVIVPVSVTLEKTQHLAPSEIAILNALPILIIVALVVMAAGALYLKRDD